jgi:salicylate hydroxylase
MKQKVLIIGAGLGGLTAAGCLLKAGFTVEVYEQAPSLAEVGAGIQMSANAMHVLNYLGIGEKISRQSVRPAAYVFRLHNTGEIVDTFSLSDEHLKMHNAPYNQAHRADLHRFLYRRVDELKKNCVHLNKKLIKFEEFSDGVTVYFEDGTSGSGDILVGADGVKSIVRDQMFGATQAEYTGDSAWRVTVPRQNLPENFMEHVMSVWMGPGKHAVTYWIKGGELLNFVGCVETPVAPDESWTAKFSWNKLQSDFEGWHPDIQRVISLADRNECYRWALYNRPVVKKWSTDRVTILGDAAHSTLPYLAQGAAMAIEDGAILARALLQSASIPDGLRLYQENRYDRTKKVVETSNMNRRIFHLNSAAEIKEHFSNRSEGDDRNGWLYSYNPLTVDLV